MACGGQSVPHTPSLVLIAACFKNKTKGFSEHTLSGITPVSCSAFSLLPNAFITTFLIKEN